MLLPKPTLGLILGNGGPKPEVLPWLVQNHTEALFKNKIKQVAAFPKLGTLFWKDSQAILMMARIGKPYLDQPPICSSHDLERAEFLISHHVLPAGPRASSP